MSLKDIITIIISGLAFILSFIAFVFAKKRAKGDALLAYLAEADSESMRTRRTHLYESEEKLKQKEYQENIKSYFKYRKVEPPVKIDEIQELEKNITDEIAFYDKWALLANRRYLPWWVIHDHRATVFMHVYEIVEFYIKIRREKNDLYASDMTKLYTKLKTKQLKKR